VFVCGHPATRKSVRVRREDADKETSKHRNIEKNQRKKAQDKDEGRRNKTGDEPEKVDGFGSSDDRPSAADCKRGRPEIERRARFPLLWNHRVRLTARHHRRPRTATARSRDIVDSDEE
jgi:hypothetical protein